MIKKTASLFALRVYPDSEMALISQLTVVKYDIPLRCLQYRTMPKTCATRACLKTKYITREMRIHNNQIASQYYGVKSPCTSGSLSNTYMYILRESVRMSTTPRTRSRKYLLLARYARLHVCIHMHVYYKASANGYCVTTEMFHVNPTLSSQWQGRWTE